MFEAVVKSALGQADWATQRELIRLLVKRVEIDKDRVNVVYRVDISPFDRQGDVRHHCRGRASGPFGFGAKTTTTESVMHPCTTVLARG
ncbi:MAG: hypothetical protein ACHRHE_08360 [Tepidisphaerales bacterium]